LSRKTDSDKSPPTSKETPTSTKGPDEETPKHSTVPTDTSTEDHSPPVELYSRPKREVKTPKNLSYNVRYFELKIT